MTGPRARALDQNRPWASWARASFSPPAGGWRLAEAAAEALLALPLFPPMLPAAPCGTSDAWLRGLINSPLVSFSENELGSAGETNHICGLL